MIFHRASDEFTCSLQQEHSLTQEEVKRLKRGEKITKIIKTNSLRLDILLASRYEI